MAHVEKASALADRLRGALPTEVSRSGVSVHGTLRNYAIVSLFLPDGDGFMVQVSDDTDTVRILDADAEELSEDALIRYAIARTQGESPRAALRRAR